MKSKMLLSVYVVSLFVILSGCSKKPGSVINDFYEAKTWEKKKAFILDPAGLKPNDLYDEQDKYIVQEILFEKKIDETTSIFNVRINGNPSRFVRKNIIRLVVTMVGEEEKIDFKTSFGINDPGFLEFFQLKPSEPKKFWSKVDFIEKYDDELGNVLLLSEIDRNTEIVIPIASEGLSEDIAKLKEFAILNKEGLVMVEISGKPERLSYARLKIKQEEIKFVKFNTLNQN